MLPDRLEWSGAPYMSHVLMPFLATLLPGHVEIHDLVSLQVIQRIELASPIYICSCGIGAGLGHYLYALNNGGKLHALKMVPLSVQVYSCCTLGND